MEQFSTAQMPNAARRDIWSHPWLPYLLIAVVAFIVLVPGTGRMPLIDRDEPRFAQATQEMMSRHEWIIPYFNQHYRFDKPVMTYWLMRGGYKLFGVDEFGARWHSIFSTLLIALVIFAWGRRRFSGKVGGAAALGFLTCLQIFLNGRSATADMPMILAVTVSQVALYELLCNDEQRHTRRWFYVLYVALGFGFLAKGPIAVLVPLLTAVLLRYALWRQPLPWRRLKLHWGVPLFLVIIGAWGVPALYRTNGLFWQVGMQRHVIDRGLEVFNGRFYTPFFYLVTAFFSLSPWIAFAGGGFRAVRAHWDRTNAFLVAWLLAPYLVFTFYATQLPHYVMPAFPAFFLLTAQVLERPRDDGGWVKWWWRGTLALPVLLAAVLALALMVAATRKAPTEILLLLLAGALLTSAVVILAFGVKTRRNLLWMGGLLMIAAAAVCAGRGLRGLVPAAQMQTLFKQMPADSRYLGYRFTEGSLVFYSHAPWEMTHDVRQLKQFLDAGGPRLAVVLETETKIDRYLKWELNRRRDPSSTLQYDDYGAGIDAAVPRSYRHRDFKGLNLGRFSWVTIRVYYRSSDQAGSIAWDRSNQQDGK
jgi:4-amino-4-deoxy-L-arabinose transferase-like glycosyltransferase